MRRARTVLPLISSCVLLSLGLAPSPVRLAAPAEARSCTAPAFWDPFDRRCEVYMCATGWTLGNDNVCRKSGAFPTNAASCPVGWGVRAVHGGFNVYAMQCVARVTSGPRTACNEGYTFNPSTNRCERNAPPLSLPGISGFRVPSGGVVNTVFPAATGGRPPYSYSLTGLPAGISFSSSTRRARGTLPTVLVDTTYRITYSVRDSRGATASVTFTTVVTAPRTSPPPPPPSPSPPPPAPPPPGPSPTPPPPPPSPSPPPTTVPKGPAVKKGVNVSESRTYLLKLPARVEVSVNLTGMTIDFDCKLGSERCTNWGGTRDDSWSGTLDKGEHKILVYPYVTGPGDYTLTVSAKTKDTGGSTGTVTKTTTLVDVSETGISSQQTYSFKLDLNAEVEVALTGMTIDFDCRVGSDRCTNYGSTRDDSWSGSLKTGSHAVTVYPYARGPGDYSLRVTGTSTLARVATPVGGGPGAMLCEEGENGQPVEGSCVLFETIVTKAPRPPLLPPPPPPPAPPPPTPPPPPPTGGGDRTPTPSGSSLAAATSDINCEGWNIDDGDGFDADRLNEDGTTRKHRAIDIQVSSADASFFALADGVIRDNVSSDDCGYQTVVVTANRRYVHCHLDGESRLPVGTRVSRGDRIGTYGPSGVTSGPHLHLKVTDLNRNALDPVEALLSHRPG